MAVDVLVLVQLDVRLAQETGVKFKIAEDPLRCVVKGTGEVLKNPKVLERILENSRMM